jgi:hypothetical protein
LNEMSNDQECNRAELNEYDGSSSSSPTKSSVSLLFEENNESNTNEKQIVIEPLSGKTSLNKNLNLDCQSGYYQLSFDENVKTDSTSSKNSLTRDQSAKFDSNVLLERFISHVIDENLIELESEGFTDNQMVEIFVDSICQAEIRVQPSRSANELITQIGNKNTKVSKSLSDTCVFRNKQSDL